MPEMLISELEDVIRRGTRAKRVDALQRITALFLDGAENYSDAHVEVFDDVFGLLIAEIEIKARAELSRHLAPIGNAPAHLQAISARSALGEAVTDVLVRRGDHEVARSVADNRGARISRNGFLSLV